MNESKDVILSNLENEIKNIPDQMAFKIGDVADLIQVKPYVLRYWEQEFKALSPKKAANNQRIYSRRDVETAILIKNFLYVDQFSIPGARKALKEYRDLHSQKNLALYASSSSVLSSIELETQSFSNLTLSNVQFSSASTLEFNTQSKAANLNLNKTLDSAELLTEKYIKLEASINSLISNIKSVRGKLEHRFFQIGL